MVFAIPSRWRIKIKFYYFTLSTFVYKTDIKCFETEIVCNGLSSIQYDFILVLLKSDYGGLGFEIIKEQKITDIR